LPRFTFFPFLLDFAVGYCWHLYCLQHTHTHEHTRGGHLVMCTKSAPLDKLQYFALDFNSLQLAIYLYL